MGLHGGAGIAEGAAQFDIVFDVIGGELLDAAAGSALKAGGIVTHIMNRGTAGADKRFEAAAAAGTGPRFAATLVQPSGGQLEAVTKLINEKKLSMKVARSLPLEQAGAAHDEVIAGHAGGKVVLLI